MLTGMMTRHRHQFQQRQRAHGAVRSEMPESSKIVMVRDVLHGNCSLHALQNCPTNHLEKLLLKLLSLTPNDHGKPLWWPDEVVPFDQLDKLRLNIHQVIVSWHTTLAEILKSCVRFYSEHRRPPTNAAKVKVSLKHQKRDSSMSSPVVVVRDVLKSRYPILDKSDFMGSLQLQPSCSNQGGSNRAMAFANTAKYSPRIPFSSVYGRKLVRDERYNLNEQLYERKRDWTNTYLSDKRAETPPASISYNVTFSKEKACKHVYKFPRRQHRQTSNAISSFRDIFCKPVSVALKRTDISNYLKKRELCRRVCIVIDKTETDRLIMNSNKPNKKSGFALVSKFSV